MSKLLKKLDLKHLTENPKFIRISITIGIVAILLIFISSYIDIGSLADSKSSSDEYCTKLENDLLSIVSEIQGVGRTKIFLTMDNSGENVYLSNSDTKTKSITPVVRGVVVVCDGGEDPVVANRVMLAVTRSLDISSNKVCITKLSN